MAAINGNTLPMGQPRTSDDSKPTPSSIGSKATSYNFAGYRDRTPFHTDHGVRLQRHDEEGNFGSSFDFRKQWASRSLENQLETFFDDVEQLPKDSIAYETFRESIPRWTGPIAYSFSQAVPIGSGPISEPEKLDKTEKRPSVQKIFNVGIIGAGMAGLATAYIFDYLKSEYNLRVNYNVIEENSRTHFPLDQPEKVERGAKPSIGGRLYTYHFPQTSDSAPVTKHDYYDVGAMRFPDNPIMKRTFRLFNQLGMKKNFPPHEVSPKYGDLVPYYLAAENTPLLFNGIQKVPKVTDPWTLSKEKITAQMFGITDIPDHLQDREVTGLISNEIQSLINIYKNGLEGPKKFWDELKEHDKFSTREWLTHKVNYDFNTIQFLETMNFGDGWYNESFSEMVLSNMDFAFGDNVKWWCVEGGAQQLPLRLFEALAQKDQAQFGQRVKALSYTYDDQGLTTGVDVSCSGTNELPRHFDAVFNSVPLGAMQHMELDGLKLNWGTKQAIRSVGIGSACKIGIRFSTMWWMKAPYNITQGGYSRTDLPVRICVYPSYNIHDDPDKPGVLLASYTWGAEADRIGALIARHSPGNEDELLRLLFHDLARLHTNNDDDYKNLRELLKEQYLDHYSFDWFAHPTSVGAIAWFGPGQFTNLYPHITSNDGKHIIIGEATCAHHAWVAGVLESAARGVYQFLHRHRYEDEAAWDAWEAYRQGQIPEPWGPLPAEFDAGSIADVGPVKGVAPGSGIRNAAGKPPAKPSKAQARGDLAALQVDISKTVQMIEEKQGRPLGF